MAQFTPAISPSNQGSPRRESPSCGSAGGGSPAPPAVPSTGSSTGGSTSGALPSVPPAGSRCCETGRPIFTDPITGHTVCSCQYDMLGYQRLPGLGMYTPPYPPEAMAAYFPALGPDQPPFYPTGAVGLDVKDGLPTGAPGWPYPSVYHPYDAAFAGYPFNGYGMDLNGARRKNATRETTSTLKAWLNEHKKNPYPTKGEKIMLAIITKMTLTQVSTWFANARRRLKKENKMTWEPRNRVDDEDNNNEDSGSGRKSADNKDHLDSKDSGTASSEDGDRGRLEERGSSVGGGERSGGGGGGDTGSEWSGSRPGSPECLYMGHPSPSAPKPRIWSLADMAAKEDSRSGGKMPSPLAARLYPRPPEAFYRGLYGPPDPALLETYSRMAAHSSGMPPVLLSSASSSAELKSDDPPRRP